MKRLLQVLSVQVLALWALPLLIGDARADSNAQPEIAPIDAVALQKEIAARKGKIMVVDFWATWCDACVAKLPDLLALRREYSARGLDLMLVSADDLEDAKTQVAPFLKTRNVDFKSWIVREEIYDFIKRFEPNLKGAFALPRTYIYNRDGKRLAVLNADASSADLRKILASLLPSPKK